ncbi:uncharacterized protein [Palaemon carinicauda]|uniref:uncharacterized protein n=1 Tax=Palaemon carinicauda TaxID=392227 RepID=UPI0035B6A09D
MTKSVLTMKYNLEWLFENIKTELDAVKFFQENKIIPANKKCRRKHDMVCAETILKDPIIIGGENKTVEIDETYYSKRKYNRGRELPEQWVFGGICRETKESNEELFKIQVKITVCLITQFALSILLQCPNSFSLPDDKFSISDANNTVNFTAAVYSYTALASWTSDMNNKITFEGFQNLISNPQRLFKYISNSSQSNTWNLFTIHRRNWEVEIHPGNRTYTAYWQYDLRITIKSTKKTYWRFCVDAYQCDLPAPVPPATKSTNDSCTVPTPSTRETALNFTSIVLLSICCVLVAIVIGMAVYIIRGRRASLNESGSNMNSEAIYEEVELSGNVSRAQQNHDFENVIYGAVIPRQA